MNDKRAPYHVQLAAARDLLDRAGLGKAQIEVELPLKPWQDFTGILVEVPDPG